MLKDMGICYSYSHELPDGCKIKEITTIEKKRCFLCHKKMKYRQILICKYCKIEFGHIRCTKKWFMIKKSCQNCSKEVKV